MNEKLITPPTTQAITLAEAKTHLRLTVTSDDVYVTSLIGVATDYVESFCGRKLITQTWEKYYQSWDDISGVPFGQLQQIDQITWLDEDGLSDTVAVTDYIVTGVGTDHPAIEIDDDADMSNDLYQVDPIQVRFTCGYYAGGDWVALTAYELGDLVVADNNLIAECTAAGTSAATEPTWPGSLDDTVVDGTATWTITGRSVHNMIKQALLIMVVYYYENREPSLNNDTQRAINNMLLPFRIWK